MDITGLTVYVVSYTCVCDGDYSDDLLGVFSSFKDARAAMERDINDIKEDWTHIDFSNPKEWDCIESEWCYEGFAPCGDNRYAVCIREMKIQ